MNLAIVVVGFGELMFVDEQAAEAIRGAQLEFRVHLDGFKRTDLGADAAAHADGEINIERGRVKLLLVLVIRFLVLALDDVDALGRTFLFANLTRHAAHTFHRIIAVEHEERKLARVLDGRGAFLRILHRGQTLVADVTAEEIPRSLRHTFDDSFAKHGAEDRRFDIGSQDCIGKFHHMI